METERQSVNTTFLSYRRGFKGRCPGGGCLVIDPPVVGRGLKPGTIRLGLTNPGGGVAQLLVYGNEGGGMPVFKSAVLELTAASKSFGVCLDDLEEHSEYTILLTFTPGLIYQGRATWTEHVAGVVG